MSNTSAATAITIPMKNSVFLRELRDNTLLIIWNIVDPEK